LRERIDLGAGALGVTHQVLVQDNAEVTSAVAHLFERAAAIAQQVDERNALGIEQLEREPHPLGRILDAGEGVGDVDQQVLAPAQVAALVAQRDPHLRESVLRLARALRRLGRPAGEALQRHVEGLLLDTGGLRGEPQLLQRLDPTPILSAVLPIASAAEIEQSIDAPRPPTVAAPISAPLSVRMPRVQQLGLAAEGLEPARGAIARAARRMA